MYTNETLQHIMARRSVRLFKPETLGAEALSRILEAGQAAPYAVPDSRQFSVICDKSVIKKLNDDTIAEGIQRGGLQKEIFSRPGFDATCGAPAVVVVAGNERTAQYEAACGAAAQNMLIAAQSLGIGSCWAYFPIIAISGKNENKWRETLRIPEWYKPCIAVLLGYGAAAAADAPDSRYKNIVYYTV